MAVVVDLDKCTGCYACEIACPYALFTIINGKARVDNSNCINCGICKQACENGAIRIVMGKGQGGGAY
ncbi:MAG: 4Fe-4S binding protein [Dehalococcoidales bacterium]|nr:4Fe-4S binding protein [Dehalococcoidales bacterium]